MLTQEQLYKVTFRQLELLEEYPNWRKGQAFFNAMYELYPDIANSIRGRGEFDCFYDDSKIHKIRVASNDIDIQINELSFQINQVRNELKKYVVNKEIPLNIRWETFIKSGLGDHESYILSLDSYDLNNIYDYYCYERHQTISINDLIYQIPDKYRYDNENLISPIKEEILSKFIKSFEYDW